MKLLMIFVLLISLSSSAFADTTIAQLQSQWAVANYELSGDAQSLAFEALIETARQAVESNPESAELLIWKSIIESTYAGKSGGLSALGLVKSARDGLERSMELDPLALDGSAYTSLGALFYQVPPWPIAFGSSKKARKFLKKALETNPDGIDSNFFYGAFLVDEKEYAAARLALQKASQAQDRPGRELADVGRRQEIQTILTSIEGKY